MTSAIAFTILSLFSIASAQLVTLSEWGRPRTNRIKTKTRSLRMAQGVLEHGSMSMDLSMSMPLNTPVIMADHYPPVQEDAIGIDAAGNIIMAAKSSAYGVSISGTVFCVAVGVVSLF